MRFKGKKPIYTIQDTYSLDETLKPIIGEGVKKFLEVVKVQDANDESVFSIPGSFFKRVDNEYTEAEKDEAKKEWFDVLEKIIYSFNSAEIDLPDGVLEMKTIESGGKDGETQTEIIIHDQDAYDKNHKDNAEHDKKVQEGLDLFAKYFNNLWW